MNRKTVLFTSALCVFLVVMPPVHARWGALGDLVSGFSEGSGVKADVEVDDVSVGVDVEVSGGGAFDFITKGLDVVKGGVGGLAGKFKRTYTVVKGVGIALLKIIIRVGFRAWYLRYYTQILKTKVDIKIDEPQEFELEYDMGFKYGGDINKGFAAVRAKILMEEPVGSEEFRFDPDPVAFFSRAEAKVKRWSSTYSLIPLAGQLLKGIQLLIGQVKNMMRWRPETVFLVKVFSLINSARAKDDPMQFFDATLQLPVLLCRLARSVNERATMKANGGERSPRKWKKILRFKDTGILAVFEKGPLAFIQKFLKEMKVKVKAWMIDEWRDRKDKKGLTPLQAAYSNMRRTQGYLKQTTLFTQELLPLLDKVKLDKTDQEFFVKAIRVHVARRYQGLLKVFKVTGFVGGAVELGGEKDRFTSELENELALAKEVMLYRGLLPPKKNKDKKGLFLMLSKALGKMKENAGGNRFAATHINVVAAIGAQVFDEGTRLKELFDQVEWPAVMPEGLALDDVGNDEDILSFLKSFKAPPVRSKDFAFGVSPEASDEIDSSVIPEEEYGDDFGDEFGDEL